MSLPVTLPAMHKNNGAAVAPDGIPLHYTDLTTEYTAAYAHAVLLDRSHEGRIALTGTDRFELVHRMSTNDMHQMAAGEGRPTIFTNANARVIERAVAFNRAGDLLMLGGPGRVDPLRNYLQRNIFFRDDVQLHDLTPDTAQFALHGPTADDVISELDADAAALPVYMGTEIQIAATPVFIAHRKPYSVSHWTMIVPREAAVEVWKAILDAGKHHGLIAAGSLTFNTMRIRAGRPSVGRELSTDFIPLELGLWDEISFKKGCYTGQEIIARMESRNRLAKMLVKLDLSGYIDAPAELFTGDGKSAGMLTSSVKAPDGEVFAMGVVKVAHTEPDTRLHAGDITARVDAVLGVQPTQMD